MATNNCSDLPSSGRRVRTISPSITTGSLHSFLNLWKTNFSHCLKLPKPTHSDQGSGTITVNRDESLLRFRNLLLLVFHKDLHLHTKHVCLSLGLRPTSQHTTKMQSPFSHVHWKQKKTLWSSGVSPIRNVNKWFGFRQSVRHCAGTTIQTCSFVFFLDTMVSAKPPHGVFSWEQPLFFEGTCYGKGRPMALDLSNVSEWSASKMTRMTRERKKGATNTEEAQQHEENKDRWPSRKLTCTGSCTRKALTCLFIDIVVSRWT